MNNRRVYAGLGVLVLLAFGLRLYQLGYSDLTFDESASIFIARKPLAEMIPYLLRAFHEHPPGYYLLLAGWTKLVGESEVALRWLSVFFGTLSVPLMYVFGRATLGKRAGWLAALILTVTPVHIFFSQNARMYSLLGVLALTSWWLIVKLQQTDRPRFWLALAAVSFYGLSAHYYMGLVLASQVAYLVLTWRQNKQLVFKWLLWLGVPLGGVGLYMLTAPGVMSTLRRMFSAGLGSAVTSGGLRALAADLVFGPHGNLGLPAWLAVLAVVVLGVALAFRRRESVGRSIGVLLACAIFVPVLLVCLAPEALAVRYVLFVVFPMIVALVIVIEWPLSLTMSRPHWRPIGYVGSAALLAALVGLNVSRLPNHYQALNSDYGRTVRFVRANYQPGDGVIFYGPWQVIMQYYYPIGNVPFIYLPPQAPPTLDPAVTAPQLADWLRTFRRLWVIPVAVPQADPERFVTAYLNQQAYQALDQPNVALYYAPIVTTTTTTPKLIFGDELELERVDLAAGTLSAGDALVTTLSWRALKPLHDDVQVTLDLIDQGGNVWGQRIYQVGEGFMTAADWPVNQPVFDRQAVPIELGAPPSNYRLRVTVQRASSGELLTVRNQPEPDRAVLATVSVIAPEQPIADERVPGVRVDAQIGSGLQLIAYRLPVDQFVQGGIVPVTLYWRALAGDRKVKVDVALNGPDGTVVDTSRGPLGPDWYPADQWRTSEVVATNTALQIPARGTPGTYTLSVAAQDVNGQALVISGTLVQPRLLWTDRTAEQRMTWPLGQVTVAARDRVLTQPKVQTPLTVKFGDEVQLIGYDLDEANAQPGGQLRVTYYWQALKSIDRNYVVFNHLLDAAGTQQGQRDSMPVGGLYPTPFWQAGEYVRDEYVIDIAPEAAPGSFTLDFGWYDSDNGTRLAAVAATGERYKDDIVSLVDLGR